MAKWSAWWALAVGVLVSLVNVPSAEGSFVRTPWSRGPKTESPLTCVNCQFNAKILDGFENAVRWSSGTVGNYAINFVGGAPAAGQTPVWQVHALNSPGVTCGVSNTAVSGADYRINVSCTKGTQQVYSRFMLTFFTLSPPRADLTTEWGYARVLTNAIVSGNSWVSRGAQPVLTKTAVGRYSVRFPGLHDARGNAQVSMNQHGARCRIDSWNDSASGLAVEVRCQNWSLQDTDANFSVDYHYSPTDIPHDSAYCWANNPSYEGWYSPQAAYQRGMAGPVWIYHTASAPGVYTISFNDGSVSTRLNVHAGVTAGFGSSTCSVADLDERTAQVRCFDQSTGEPKNSVFSFRAKQDNQASIHHGFTQVPINGTNFKATTIDVGHGLMCGEGAAAAFSGRVLCVPPSAFGKTGETRPIGDGVVPGGAIKSIAIDNIDGTNTQVLVLGQDNVVRYASGNLTGNWPVAGGPLGTWLTYAPALNTSGQAVALKKIVVVRTIGSTTTELVGLTTTGSILSMVTVAAGRRWGPSVFHLPAGTYTDISHGRFDLYARRSDNVMFRDVRDGTAGSLGALPNGLLPVAMGGKHVLTNAGLTGGKYPCTSPKDSYGNYVCAGNANREYRWLPNGVWAINGWHYTGWPTSNVADVLTNGQPFVTLTPTIVDTDMFEGNIGSFVAWQYNSRLYEEIYYE